MVFVFCALVGQLIVYTDKETLTSERNAERKRADSLQKENYQLEKDKALLIRDFYDVCKTPNIKTTNAYKQSQNK